MTTPGLSDPQPWIVGWILFPASQEQDSAYSSDHSSPSPSFSLMSPSPLTVTHWICVCVCVCVCVCKSQRGVCWGQIINRFSGCLSENADRLPKSSQRRPPIHAAESSSGNKQRYVIKHKHIISRMYEICGVWAHVCVRVCVCVDVICCMCWYRRHSQSHRQSVFTTAASINLSSFINLCFFLLRDPGSLGADTSVRGCLRGRAELKGSRGTQCDMSRLIITTLCWLTGKMGQSKTRPGGRIWLWTSSVLAFCNGLRETKRHYLYQLNASSAEKC